MFNYTVPQIAKSVVALVLTAATALGAMIADGQVEWVEIPAFAGAVVAAWGVFQKRNALS